MTHLAQPQVTCKLEPCGRVQFAPVIRGVAIFGPCMCEPCRAAQAEKFKRLYRR